MRLARLTQRSEFLAAAAHGRRFRSSVFTVQVRDAAGEPGRDGLRLGLTASRKAGHAVERNRMRRRLREAARQAFAEQRDRPCDVVVIARPETLGADFAKLVSELSVALDRARSPKPSRQAPRGRSGKP